MERYKIGDFEFIELKTLINSKNKILPKYFIIKKEKDNLIRRKYIDWLNIETNNNINYIWDYVGIDGNFILNGGVGYWSNINYFENKPKLITLEEWDSIITKDLTFSLGELSLKIAKKIKAINNFKFAKAIEELIDLFGETSGGLDFNNYK